jgi:uncharacterized protein (TIGR03083 family)
VQFKHYLDAIRTDGDLIAATASRGLDRPVPVCPPWDVRDVVAHLATVYDNKVMAMRLGRRPEEREWVTDAPFGKDTVEWFEDEQAKLLAELTAHQPSEHAWTWWPQDQTVGFWYRRMALETVVHRVDVEDQFGTRSAIDADLAVDGIDEVLTIMLAGEEGAAAEIPGTATVVLSVNTAGSPTADDAATWTVKLEDSGTTITAGRAASPDAVLSGEAATMFLYLWGRAGVELLSCDGDAAAVALMRARLAAATQ